MDQFGDWHQRISEGKVDSVLKNEIADKILELLKQKKDSLGEWEKMYFAQAITAFSINVNSMYQPTEAGLILCLNTLQKVMIAEIERDESYTKMDIGRELFSYSKLIAAVENIKSKIPQKLVS
jgi:hypothetical protein